MAKEPDKELINMDEWYTATAATKRLEANSGRKIPTSYPRTLAKYGKVRVLELSDRMHLYFKADIDAYIVEDRGEKAGRVKRQKAVEGKKEGDNKPERPAA